MADPHSAPSALSGQNDEKARAKARVGRTVNNKWRLDALLGVGGMASVYAATHRNGSRAALKILHTEFGRDAGIRERFLREGYVANKIEHRGRVAILDDDVTELDEPFLVMELLEGETVQQLWKRKSRKVPILEGLWIAEEVLDTLESFHAQGIVHRDLKPANIFVTKEEVVKLLDFGVARMREAGGDMTRAGTALGTPSFMAPEQAMGLTDGIDGRADLFSVGATLYAILSGQRLHQGRSDNEAFILAATQPAPSLARVAPELPVEVIALVDKALAWDPRNRFENAAAMRAEVLRIIDALGGGAKKAEAPAPRRGQVPQELQPEDLAEEEPEEEEEDAEPNDPAVLRLVDMFRRLERLLPTVRQYGWEHPETDNKLRTAFQGVIEALRGDPSLVHWTLKPYSFLHRGQTIWEPGQPFDAVPYNLFAAGIRGIRLLPGITEEELHTLCEVFLIDPARDLTPEDDVATALWEKRLEHVGYDVINAFAEGDAADRENFYEEADSLEEVARRAAEERANLAEAAAMAVETDGAALNAARKAAAALGLDPVAKKALGAQLGMSAERWSERFIDVLVAAFLDAKKRDDTVLITEPLDASVRDLLLAHKFEVIFSMHEALSRALDSSTSKRESAGLRQELTRGMFTAETLRMMVREAVRTPVATAITSAAAGLKPVDLDVLAQGLGPVMQDLGPGHLEVVMEVVGTVTHEGLRRVLLGYLERTLPGRETEIIDRVMTLDVETARPIMKILAAVRTQTSLDALRRLSQCVNANLRCEAMAHLAQSPDQLKDQLSELAESDKPDLRFAAIRTLAYHQVRAAGPLLVRRVQDASFHQLSVDERREILSCLYTLHPARAESLSIEIVGKHGIIADDAVEQTRALTAELLGKQSKSQDALDAVLAATKRRWWNSEPLRDAATVAAEAIATRLGKRITSSGEIQ